MQEPFFTHRRKNIFHKDYTLCGVVVQQAEWMELHIGVAVCSTEDMFEKRVGREIAESNAYKNPIAKVIIDVDTPMHTFLNFSDSFIPETALFSRIGVLVDVK